MAREILVIKRGTLFRDKEFQGFLQIKDRDYSSVILANFEYQERSEALEKSPFFQQIIPYVWIVNKKERSAFLYVRSKEGEEGRLHNKYSGGVGGHIDRDTDEHSENPIMDAMMRELKEEVAMDEYPTPKFIGFLNDDSDPVGEVHFGMVAVAETTGEVTPVEHMSSGKFYTVEEIDKVFSNSENNVESWTKLSWPHVKKYITGVSGDLDALRNKILEIYVTSATDPIYAVKPTVQPEIFGAFGSYFSRNPKDFREHLWNVITGQLEGEDSKVSEKDIRWLAKRTFKTPSDFITEGLVKSQDFFKRWYGKYSHKSIANTVWVPIVMTNVSQLFAKELAYDQLAFFIEQSTRYVKFNADNMYHDPEIMQSKHKDLYMETLDVLAKSYDQFTEHAKEFYKAKFPYAEWIESQSTQTKMLEPKQVERKYEREISGKALDLSRFLLPQAIKTNIAFILDARSLEYDIASWKGHPLFELREGANYLEKSAGQLVPSLLKYTEESKYYGDKLNAYGGDLKANPPQAYEKGVDVISHDADSLDRVIAHLLQRHNVGGTFRQRYSEAKHLTFNEKIDILRRVTEKKGRFDEWIEADEDFDLTNITIEIRTDIGAIRDWRRHQKWERGEPFYTLDNGHHRPAVINEMNLEAQRIFDSAISAAHKAEMTIRKDHPFAVQYLIPMAANHTIVMSGGLDQLQYMIWTRSTPQGNFSYRMDAFNIAEAVCKQMPWLLGYLSYPQGKTFERVYKEAPMKSIIRIQGWEEGMHE